MTPVADASRIARAAAWRLDVKGAEVRASLAAAGVPSMLLKGRAFAALLYTDGTERPYCDCDLLVPVGLAEIARAVLTDLGFAVHDGATHARSWVRERDRVWIDLHHTLPQLGAAPEHVWTTLWARSTTLSVGGAPTQVLDPSAAALLAALHLVHHGPDAVAPRRDLERAIRQLGDDCWRSAGELARQLDAEAPFGTGLRLLPAGVKIAERLGLGWAPSPRTLLNWHRAPFGATVWEALAEAPDVRARLLLLARFLAPGSDLLRQRSALARRGPLGLMLTYLVRPWQLTIKALRALAPWLRLRRADEPPGGAPGDR